MNSLSLRSFFSRRLESFLQRNTFFSFHRLRRTTENFLSSRSGANRPSDFRSPSFGRNASTTFRRESHRTLTASAHRLSKILRRTFLRDSSLAICQITTLRRSILRPQKLILYTTLVCSIQSFFKRGRKKLRKLFRILHDIINFRQTSQLSNHAFRQPLFGFLCNTFNIRNACRLGLFPPFHFRPRLKQFDLAPSHSACRHLSASLVHDASRLSLASHASSLARLSCRSTKCSEIHRRLCRCNIRPQRLQSESTTKLRGISEQTSKCNIRRKSRRRELAAL